MAGPEKFHWKGFMPESSPIKPQEDTIPEMSEWFRSSPGCELLADQQERLAGALQCLFGYFLLELGLDPAVNAGAASRISHRFSLHPAADLVRQRPSAQADYHQLPLPDSSIDAAILHHVLDFSPNPHQLLREASRLIIPRGHLLIVGFNPGSCMGIARWVMRFFSRKAIWHRQSLAPGRVIDWLKLLDFEPVALETGFFRVPLRSARLLKHLHWMERWGKKLRLRSGGYYLIVARKDIAGVTPLVKPAWKSYSGVMAASGVIRIVSRCDPVRGYRRLLAPKHPWAGKNIN